jgi:hypothetical protein
MPLREFMFSFMAMNIQEELKRLDPPQAETSPATDVKSEKLKGREKQ